MVLGLFPERVQWRKLDAPGLPIKRLAHLPPMSTPYWWTAMFPGQYPGDARQATMKKGRYLVEYEVSKVAAIIRAVKRDREVKKVAAEFFAAADSCGGFYGAKKKVRLLR